MKFFNRIEDEDESHDSVWILKTYLKHMWQKIRKVLILIIKSMVFLIKF